jgi:hypothetical protein
MRPGETGADIGAPIGVVCPGTDVGASTGATVDVDPVTKVVVVVAGSDARSLADADTGVCTNVGASTGAAVDVDPVTKVVVVVAGSDLRSDAGTGVCTIAGDVCACPNAG